MASSKTLFAVQIAGSGERTAKDLLLELLRRKSENLTYGAKR